VRRFWYKWKLRVWTRKTRQAKARWLSIMETIKHAKKTGDSRVDYMVRLRCPVAIAEDAYCDALIELRYYEKLLANPLPKATARKTDDAA